MYACLAVTCHLHFWQNDRDFLRATVVTRGWNGYRNKSQHRKSTLEKKILPPFQQGFEPATFQSRVRCSNHWAIPAPSRIGLSLSLICHPTSEDIKHHLKEGRRILCVLKIVCGWANKTWSLPYACCGLHFSWLRCLCPVLLPLHRSITIIKNKNKNNNKKRVV